MFKIIFMAMNNDEPLTSNNLGIIDERFETKEEARKYFLEEELRTITNEWKDGYDNDPKATVEYDEYGKDGEFDVYENYDEDTCETILYKIVEA